MSEPELTLAERYEQVTPALYAWARLRLRNYSRVSLEAEDVVSETWLRVLELHDRFDPEVSSFRAWIFRVAKYVLLEFTRRRAAGPSVLPGSGATSKQQFDRRPANVTSVTLRVARADTVRTFLAAIDTLSDDDRQLLVHCGFEELPHAEVATRMGINQETVTKRWQRLRQRIRTQQGSFAMIV